MNVVVDGNGGDVVVVIVVADVVVVVNRNQVRAAPNLELSAWH